MDEILLFLVDDAFQIKDRGCILVPGVSTEPGSPTVRVGTCIRLVTPTGESIHTSVKGLEMLNFGAQRPDRVTAPILLPKELSKEMIPKGTKVFLASPENQQ